MKIVYFGSGEFGCPTLQWLVDSRHDILEIITQPDRPAGRGKKIQPTPIAQLAQNSHRDYRGIEDIKKQEFIEHIIDLKPEILLVIAFGQKVPDKLIQIPNCRAINLHSSLLPKYRGAAPINWAIINGDKQTGLTIIELNEIWDAGAILAQSVTDIYPTETAGQLHDRLARMGPKLVSDTLDKIAHGTDQAIAQDATLSSRAPKMKRTDGAINWGKTAEQIRNHIHGTWPWPGAYCYLQQQNKKPLRVKIARAEVAPSAPSTQPGMLMENLTIACGSNSCLKLLQVQPEGKKLIDFTDFVNGRHLRPGNIFLNG